MGQTPVSLALSEENAPALRMPERVCASGEAGMVRLRTVVAAWEFAHDLSSLFGGLGRGSRRASYLELAAPMAMRISPVPARAVASIWAAPGRAASLRRVEG
jgi:hypothetical protein